MPEVSEIALTAEILYKKLKNKILVSFDFIGGRYGPNRTKPDGFKQFEASLPLKIKKVDSKGKFLWFELKSGENTWYIMNTFGLTGMWSFFEPRYCKAILTFSDDTIVYYSDLRNFGTFKFTTEIDVLQQKLSELAPDFLKETKFNFDKLKKFPKALIVDILTDQKKIGSGIGNYLVSEILYRAKLSPHRTSASLTPTDIENLEYWIKYMVKLSYVSNNIGYMVNLTDEANKIPRKNYHPDIKLGKSDASFAFSVYRQKTDPVGNKVSVDKRKGGRSTYWVKKVQV